MSNNPIEQMIATDLAAFEAFQGQKRAEGLGVSYILELIRSDGQALVGEPDPNHPNLVAVYGKQPLKQVFDLFAKLQGEGVTISVANLADFTVIPRKTREGKEAHEFVCGVSPSSSVESKDGLCLGGAVAGGIIPEGPR